jgi:sugar O-acyltransferase (sialic acid O-acetyltransferase NeuD family)
MSRRRLRQDGALGRMVIVGAGGFGRELRGWMLLDRRPESIVFLDDRATGPGVIGTIESYERQEGDEVLIAIADPKQKQAAAERFAKLGTYISTTAVVGESQIGEGCVILPGVIVTTNVTLGNSCALNLQTIIGHDTVIGDYCQLSPLVDIMGNVKIGARCFFGGSAVVIPHVTIGDDCTIGAGAVVIRDVPSGSRVVGNPGRII